MFCVTKSKVSAPWWCCQDFHLIPNRRAATFKAVSLPHSFLPMMLSVIKPTFSGCSISVWAVTLQAWETRINWDGQPRQSSSALVSAQAIRSFDSLIQGRSFLSCSSFSAPHQQCYQLPTSPCSLSTSHFLFAFLRQTLVSHTQSPSTLLNTTPTPERTPISLNSPPKITSQLSLCGLPLQLWELNWPCFPKHLLPHGQLWDLHPGQATSRSL